MSRRIHFVLVVLITGLLAGCASRYGQKFSEQADDFKIRKAVIGYLLERRFWDDGNYTAIFLTGSDEEVDALMRSFPNHVPPIKRSYHSELRPNRVPMDKDTGKPAIILSAESSDPMGDKVDAVGRWYAGEMVSGVRTFSLKKQGTEWVIESVR